MNESAPESAHTSAGELSPTMPREREAKGRLRALHLSAGNLFGGIETYLLTLARCASLEPRMQSEFAVCFPGRLRDELSRTNQPVHDLGPVRISRPWTVLRARHRLSQVLRDAKPDVVVAHGSWQLAVFGPTIKRRAIPIVLAVHGHVTEASLLDRWALRSRPDLLLANSDFTASGLDTFAPGIAHVVCRYPVAPTIGTGRRRDEVRRELGTDSAAVVVIQVSRLERWKGQHVLVRALADLVDVPSWECWIVGGVQRPAEQEYLDELRGLAEATGNAHRIKFLGQRSDVADLLQAADIFCQPNAGPEPFGIVFVEALYAGLGVVTSDFGGGAEIVTGECGFLTRPGDASAVARELRELLRSQTPRDRMRAAGPLRAAQLCDPAHQIRRLYEILSNIEVKR